MPFQSEAATETPQRLATPSALKPEGWRGRVKVVFVIDNMNLGGTELNAVRTAEQLDRERFDLRVVCLGSDGPLTERYAAMGVPVENMPIHSFYGSSMIRSGRRFVRMLRREHVDIVHAHDVYSNIFSAAWTRTAAVPILITSRRWWSSLPNWKLRLGSRFAVARSTAILANSNAVAALIAVESPSARARVRTVTNFVDDRAFGMPSADERRRLREAWKAPVDAVVIGCVARLHPIKDHVTLLRAFALLHTRQSRTYLVLLGDGEMRPVLEALVTELGLAESVYFTGEQRSQRNLHRGLDISVLSSTSEGFPNSLVEAMAAGNPVVATAVGGSVDAVVNEETGLLVAPGKSEELANALERLTIGAELRDSFGRAGALRARQQFHVGSVVPVLEQMYDGLVAGREL